MNPPIQVCIIGNSQATPHQMEVAEAAGRILASHGHTVVTGGRTGVMEAAAKGAREAGGIAVGILPTEDTSSSNSYNNVVIPTGMGYTRNALNILAAKAVICVGGMVGMVLTGVFAAGVGLVDGHTETFLWHLAALAGVGLFAFSGSYGLFWVVNKAIPLRVTTKQEKEGLDGTQHGERI